jgi:hypothetical protein
MKLERKHKLSRGARIDGQVGHVSTTKRPSGLDRVVCLEKGKQAGVQ